MWKAVVAACAAIALTPAIVVAQPLSLSDVISRARERAPRVVAARLAIDEARARVTGARLRPNPELEGGLGHRRATDGQTVDLDVGVTQRFDPAGRRDARVTAAEAGVLQATAEADQVTRTVILDVVAAYLRAVQADERERLLGAAEQLAAAIHQTAERRFRAGDVAILDVNVARAGLARVRADREAARGAAAQARGDLAIELGLVAPATVAAPLPSPTPPDLDALLRAALERPEIRSLEAAIGEAEATVALGRTFSKPEFGAGARYARDERDNVVSGVLTVTLPVFARGQDLVAQGGARASRLRAELDSLRLRAQTEVRTAAEALERRRTALQLLEQDAMPAIEENETLATRSYEAGQIGLAELLLIRREILETRFQYLDARIEAARARIDLDAAAGVLR